MFKLFKIIFYCFFAIYYCQSYADKIWMKNGDILTGTIKLIDENKLVMASPYAGNLTIKVENIKTFTVDKPSIVKNDLYANKYYINKIKASDQSSAIITVDPDGEEQTVSITNNLILIKQKENSIFNEFTFNGNIRGGFFFEKSSKKTEQYIFDTDFVIKHNMWRQNISSNLRRSLKNDNVSTYFYTLQYNLDHFVSPKLFWQSNVICS